MLRWCSYVVLFILLVGCKTSYINQGKVIPHDDYEHYYVVKEQGTDKDVQESVESISDKVKKVFKKKPVKKPTTVTATKELLTTNNIVKIPKRRVRYTEKGNPEPIVIDGGKLMPMTNDQVEIVELKNTFISTVTYIQAFVIVCLVGFLYFSSPKKSKKKINKDNNKVLNL